MSAGRIPFVDLASELAEVGDEVRRAVIEVVDSTRYVLGPRVAELEARIAELCGARHAVGVSSGTDALLLSLIGLGVGPGDLVITTAFSFFSTAAVITRVGAEPVFLDIDPGTFNLSPAAIARWLQENPERAKRVKAVLPAHLFGQCADMVGILEQTEPRGIAVIEDAAQALGATVPVLGALRGAGSVGRCGCFSFYPTKNLGALGEAGMIVTSDGSLADRLRGLRSDDGERGVMVGGNFRLDEIQAAVLLAKLPYLAGWNARRRRHAERYDAAFASSRVVAPARAYERAHHTYHQYVIRSDARDALRSALDEAGIDTKIYYPVPLSSRPSLAPAAERGAQPECPVTETACREVLALPIHPFLDEAAVDRIAEQVVGAAKPSAS